MKIIFIRHAAAIDRSDTIDEEKRYLTPKGRISFRETALTMVKKGVEPELIITSPLLRAIQTADILAESLKYKGSLEALDELEPGFDIDQLRKLLHRYQHISELVIVGHEPDLSSVITSLLGLDKGFAFKKGSAVRLTIDPTDLQSGAVFKWLALGRKLTTSQEEAFG